MTEFDLIDRFFTRAPRAGGSVRRGIGDDCALIDCGERLLAMSTDLLVEQRHFFADVDAESLGHKALAVNLSDLAAAGASPRAFELALALPRADERWLAAFARGLFALADAHGCELVGGDTTRAPRLPIDAGTIDAKVIDGPITVCITAIGELPPQAARGRDGARAGDDLWVSGTLGDAAAALAWRRGELPLAPTDAAHCVRRMDWPTPRVALGVALRAIAGAVIDVSDGLLGDLGHILRRSRAGATVHWAAVPVSDALRSLPIETQRRCALAGGDDYELLFTADRSHRAEVEQAAASCGEAVTRIGCIEAGDGLRLLDFNGAPMPVALQSFDHFAGRE